MTGKMKPILFSTPMVRAIIDGMKTQTRRVIKPQPPTEVRQDNAPCALKTGTGFWAYGHEVSPKTNSRFYFEYKNIYQPGDVLWVRGEAARIFLRITGVGVERVQDIMTIDAIAEGCAGLADIESGGWEIRPEKEFSALWDSIYAKSGYGWDENPFCWVYTFERVEETQNE